MSTVVRPGSAADLPALTRVYNHYVLHDIATFDIEPYTPDSRRPWLELHGGSGPYRLLVADVDDVIAGYATSSPFRPKPGYRSTVESSVYLAPDHVGQGLGRMLYAALLPILDQEGVHRVVAGVALPNPASIALHQRFGFRPVGVYTQVGIKLGRYVDVQWFERHHPGQRDRPPAAESPTG